MTPRVGLILSGAAGLALAALFYLAAAQIRGILSFTLLNPIALTIIFVILFGISLLEIAVMFYALRHLAASKTPPILLDVIAFAYVAFASIYAVLFFLFVSDTASFAGSIGAQILAALSLARFATLFWIHP